MPQDEPNLPTRALKRASLNPSVQSAVTGGSAHPTSPTLDLSIEALRNEERARLRVTAQVMVGIAGLGIALTPLLGGDPFAKHVFIAGLSVALATMAVLLRSSYVATYNANLIGAGAVSLAISYACTLYYIGPFSQAAMTGALGLYIFCLGSGRGWAKAVYAALAGPHAVLVALGTLGVITDRGLIRATSLPASDQLALHACVQAVYAIAYVAGRKSRGKLRNAFLELEAAARVIAQRDALLNEAKRDLERAVRVGGDGRFTDQVIGSFRLGKVIGRGGMGEVYDAVHVDTNQPAAVKLLHRNVIADPEAVARFAREAKAASAFDSPYVVRVLEISGEDSSIPYLAMERLRGEDLASMLRREQRLSSRELVDLAHQVGMALDEAQRVGVIHRDIKPQNLFLARSESGPPVWKVLDFGVSKLVGQGTLTQDQLVGTPEYMAPEQASGEKTDHRADLYGLAAVLYRCVASRAPFVENSLVVLVQKVINRMPARPSSVARVSSDIEAFLAIGLAKSPAERFETGAELAEVFALAVEGRLNQAQRTRARHVLDGTPWSEGPVALSMRPHAG